jgi:hypothetical protein
MRRALAFSLFVNQSSLVCIVKPLLITDLSSGFLDLIGLYS